MSETDDALNGSARKKLRRMLEDWEANELAAFLARQPEGREEYETASGLAVKRIYTALEGGQTPLKDIGLPVPTAILMAAKDELQRVARKTSRSRCR